ncbi:hypothetical protein [Streptomyces sp. NRRL S-646]|uniref:hypothetical protein n=1 Tax=Streptomyces sp. NRRL S-646 TaxID=1463917 RepID=UPI0004C96E1D|nr:hypothetical protein [Streptomyces sp. NRRL S-646]
MEVVATSVIAVFGTLLGSALTYVFQRRTADRAQQFTRNERLRQERIEAYCAFAGALANYRRGQMDLWFARRDRLPESELRDLRREEQALRAAALEAMFRVELLTEEPGPVEAGRQALESIDRINRAGTRAELDQERTTSRTLLYAFVTSSKPHVAPPAGGASVTRP